LDFWPFDCKNSRRRMATRPGYATFNSTASVNMMAELRVAPSSTYKRQPMFGAGGTLCRWDGSNVVSVGGSNVDEGRNVMAIPFLQKLYILNETLDYKVYNYTGHSVGSWTTTAGSVPTDCKIGCVWDGRIVLSGDGSNPHVVTMSRQDDPADWDVAEEDRAAAFASTSLEGGLIQEPVTALVPHNRQCLLVGTYNSWIVYRGNPRYGGTLEHISDTNGPVCATAWCRSADDYLYYMSRDGLYRMPPGCGVPPTSMSRERVPESLLGLDGVNDIVFLEYDVRFRGIHIYVTGDNAQAWWFDLEGEGFWPITPPVGTVRAVNRFDMFETEDVSGVLVGVDSGMKRLDRTASIEADNNAFIKLGPVNLESTTGQKSIIQEASVTFGDNTTDTTGSVIFYASDSAEGATALSATRKHAKTIGNLQNNHGRCHPRIGGNAALVHVTMDDNSDHISIEGIDLYLKRTGKER